MSKQQITIIGLVLVTFVISIYFYPRMPQQVASHWNGQGQVDGYMDKGIGLFIMPITMAGMAILLNFIVLLDPLRRNIEKFRPYYEGFIVFMCAFFLAIQYNIILWNLGIKLSMNIFMPMCMGILFYFCGVLCEHAKRNWFIGIRTPWTLSSDIVWAKTNHLGGLLFKIAAIVTLIGIAFQRYAIFFIIVPVFAVAIITIIYSLIIYQQEKAG